MIELSIVVITYNEEDNLARCLHSVKSFADEIIVIDSNSTDRTRQIAEEYGAKVIIEPFKGYVAQKNFADSQATHDWILSLDADEVVTPELEMSIRKVKEKPEFDAYELKRLTNYCGHWIRHCGWYPDKKARLFNRKKGMWTGELIHESWQLTNTIGRYGKLSGDLQHYSYHTFSDHLKQIEKYTEIMARRDVENGKTCSYWKAFFSSKWKFIQSYLLQLGFLDGMAGYQVCRLSALATFMKYSKIAQYSRYKKEGEKF